MNTQHPEQMIPEEILHLMAKSSLHKINPVEQEQLEAWLKLHPLSEAEMEQIQEVLERIHWQILTDHIDVPEAWNKMQMKIKNKKNPVLNLSVIFRWAAVFLVLAGITFLLLHESDQLDQQEKSPLVEALPQRMQKASLKLADGSVIALDTAQLQLKALTYEIKNQPGEMLSYSKQLPKGQTTDQPTFHELIVPAGARYQLVLADGTKVTMNAASKLTYPVSFSDEERRVKLEGEAYFEVVSSVVPFIVEAGEQEVSVLGTAFNVSAYQEDANLETTLVSGKVRVKTKANEHITLAPGEQAKVDVVTQKAKKIEVDTRLYTSWKDDVLYFKAMELRELVKRLERWYAIPIVIKNKDKAGIQFTGAIENSRKVEFLLSLIAETTSISYEVESDRIIIY